MTPDGILIVVLFIGLGVAIAALSAHILWGNHRLLDGGEK